MSIFKCKMCGGSLEINDGATVCECEYCGTKQTVPNADNDKKVSAFNRANKLRLANEFDKAAGVYESIVAEYEEEAEAYWGLCLCKYGIEYVDDPATGKKIPTCHRTQFTSIFEDSDFELALENADSVAVSVYREEAKEIDRLQKAILDIANKEEPFDIFICYKETAEDGQRTKDSVLAQDMYDKLAEKGYKVFFARITLEDKLGQEYEPYIFSALNSAKIMLAVGTKYEYYNAVWVKNEWSRFLDMMKKDKEKVLIPCYADIDAYDMPQEFKNLQGQDMGKVGFMQDLVRGIGKIIPLEAEKPVAAAPVQTVVQQVVSNSNAENLLKRGNMALEDGKWDDAAEFFEQVLNENAEEPRAYLGKLLAELKCGNEKQLPFVTFDFSGKDNYKKIMRFGDEAIKTRISNYNMDFWYRKAENIYNNAKDDADYSKAEMLYKKIPGYKDATEKIALCQEKAKEYVYNSACEKMKSAGNDVEYREVRDIYFSLRNYKDSADKATECEEKALEYLYQKACQKMNDAIYEIDFEYAAKMFKEIEAYKNSKELYNECLNKAKDAKMEAIYIKACNLYDNGNSSSYDIKSALAEFKTILNWKDSAMLAERCNEIIEERDEQQRIERETQRRENEHKIKIRNLIVKIFIISIIVISIIVVLAKFVIIPATNYKNAVNHINSQNYDQAISLLQKCRGYGDSRELLLEYLPKNTIVAGSIHTAGLRADGTVVAVGYNGQGQCDVSGWSDIIAVAAGDKHTIGLKADGTVVAAGYNDRGQCDVSSWSDIIAVAAGYKHTIGLKADGTVVVAGDNDKGQCDVSSWSDIIAVAAGDKHTVGLKADGTVVAVGTNEMGQCNVSSWSDIIAVAAGNIHTVGLKSDGTVVAVGDNTSGQCDVSSWNDIIAISAGRDISVGLTSDGIVALSGSDDYEQHRVLEWTDIIAVSAGRNYIVGLKTDGTMVAVGLNSSKQCDISGWTDIKTTN